ncbi:DUF1476 family protein [Rhizobium leguminosarum bv. viciae]|nr:DUF1476 family protein [Rhizobium leguminosarum bv. viciae]
MTTTEARRRFLEEKYILDFQMLFRTRARRNQMLAAWAASKLGRFSVDAYLKEIQLVDEAVSGDDDVIQKILADLRSTGQRFEEGDLRSMMNEMMFDAAEALEADGRRSPDC